MGNSSQLGSVIIRDGDQNGVIYYHTKQDGFYDSEGHKISLADAEVRGRQEMGLDSWDSTNLQKLTEGFAFLDEAKRTLDEEEARLQFLEGMGLLGQANARLVEDWAEQNFSNYGHLFLSPEEMAGEMAAQLGRGREPFLPTDNLPSGSVFGFAGDPGNLQLASNQGSGAKAGGGGTAALVLALAGAVIYIWQKNKAPEPDVVIPAIIPEIPGTETQRFNITFDLDPDLGVTTTPSTLPEIDPDHQGPDEPLTLPATDPVVASADEEAGGDAAEPAPESVPVPEEADPASTEGAAGAEEAAPVPTIPQGTVTASSPEGIPTEITYAEADIGEPSSDPEVTAELARQKWALYADGRRELAQTYRDQGQIFAEWNTLVEERRIRVGTGETGRIAEIDQRLDEIAVARRELRIKEFRGQGRWPAIRDELRALKRIHLQHENRAAARLVQRRIRDLERKHL